MTDTQPKEISRSEWAEIMKVDEVQEGWGLEPHETVEDFSAMVYGVKFDFISGGPGYCGDLFILVGDTFDEPVGLIRRNGVLEVLQMSWQCPNCSHHLV